MSEKARLLTARELQERTGYSLRTIQEMAASGRWSWARQPNGARGRYFFEADGFEAWW